MLVYFDPWMAGVVLPTLIIIGLMVIPYIDANPLGSAITRSGSGSIALLTFCFGFFVLWLSMIFIGTFIRGPGWMWFWPGQTWDHNRLIFEVNRDLPDLFRISGVWGKFFFGASVVLIFFVVAGWGVHKLCTLTPFNRRVFQKMSLLQYVTLQVFMITMLALPAKILLRLLFRIKYVWITPWFNI